MKRTINSLLATSCLLTIGLAPAWAGQDTRTGSFGMNQVTTSTVVEPDDDEVPPSVPIRTPPRKMPGAPVPAPQVQDTAERSATVAALLKKAQTLRAQKKYDEEISVRAAIVVLDDKDVANWTELAWLLNEKKEYKDAIEAAEEAIKLDGRHPDGWRELGYGLFKEKEYKEAFVALCKAVDFNPFNWPAYDHLAELLKEIGRPDLAAKVLELKKQEQERAARIGMA